MNIDTHISDEGCEEDPANSNSNFNTNLTTNSNKAS